MQKSNIILQKAIQVWYFNYVSSAGWIICQMNCGNNESKLSFLVNSEAQFDGTSLGLFIKVKFHVN